MNLFQESSFYQMLLEEGEKKGIEKGIEKGIQKGIEKGIQKGIEKGIQKGIEKGIQKGLISLRETLLSLGEKLLGPPDAATRASIESIDDHERLKRMALRVLTAKTWGDLVNAS